MVIRRYDVSVSSFCRCALKPLPAHHGGQAERSPKFAADTAASTILCFEAPLAFHHFLSRPAYRECGGYTQRSIQRSN
jgi:hypothetical protein